MYNIGPGDYEIPSFINNSKGFVLGFKNNKHDYVK